MPIKPYMLQSVKEEIEWKYFEVCVVGLIRRSKAVHFVTCVDNCFDFNKNC